MTISVMTTNKYNETRWHLPGSTTLHREDGPAIIKHGIYEAWCKYGHYHRIDGPAIIYENGKRFWWVNGEVIGSNEEFQKKAKISDLDMVIMILKYGNVL